MSCKYLNNYKALSGTWQVRSCGACYSLYVPSLSEINDLCKTKRHALCSAYLKSTEAIEKILGQKADIREIPYPA